MLLSCRALHQIGGASDNSIDATIVFALVSGHLDYVNTKRNGASTKQKTCYQRVQNVLARVMVPNLPRPGCLVCLLSPTKTAPLASSGVAY